MLAMVEQARGVTAATVLELAFRAWRRWWLSNDRGAAEGELSRLSERIGERRDGGGNSRRGMRGQRLDDSARGKGVMRARGSVNVSANRFAENILLEAGIG